MEIPYEPPLHWPFALILDASERQTGWTLITGPIATPAQHEQFAALRRHGQRFIGMSSYGSFPHGYEQDPLSYELICEAWCHCFRDPELMLPPHAPRALLSASDFTDFQRVSPDAVDGAGGERVDVIYVGGTYAWKREIKNWRLASRCLRRLHAELGLSALVIGAPDPDFEPSEGVAFSPPLPWHAFLSHLARARLLLAPSVLDPSPRALAEALCLDVPILVNRRILGGWKYVNRFTGAFFGDETDVVAAARAVLDAGTAPRRWFCANHGPYLAGGRLLDLVRSLDPTVAERDHLRVSEVVAGPVQAPSH